MSFGIFPEETISVQRWNPTEGQLKNSVVVVVGSSGTGKSTLIRSLNTKTLQVEESNLVTKPDGIMLHIGSFQSFLSINPVDRGNIDFLIFCGLPSRLDVGRIFDRYEHLMDVNLSEFYQITQRSIKYYHCLVIDISANVRLGNEKAKFYWCRAVVDE